MQQLEEKFDGRFDERTFKKIIFYYSLKVPAICDAFLFVHRKSISRKECERLLHYFICSSVFDNFFDREELTDEEIEQITFHSHHYVATNFNERISLQSHLMLLNYVRDKEKYTSVLRKEYEVQVASRKQFDATISNEEIKYITLEKGGNAVLLCSFYLDHAASHAEENCWYKLGNAVQYINDLFDVYRDLQTGLQTLPNRMTDAHEFMQQYMALVQSLQQEINKLECKRKSKLHLRISLMGICALGVIAIEQFIKLQGTNSTMPNLKQASRKQLIIDMEKTANLWKWVKTVYRLSKSNN